MVTREELLSCRISNWYHQYEKHTFRTILIPLPEKFVAWLLEDGFFMPASSSAFPARNKQDTIVADDDYKDWSSDDEDRSSNHSDPAGASAPPPDFPELVSAIDDAIAELGGAVVPKLTWSVPKDATWIATGNTLRCNTADQIFLLLKSSDRVSHDVSEALLQCIDTISASTSSAAPLENSSLNNSIQSNTTPPDGHYLALRKWYDLNPGREFRCFVARGHLVGISQRDVSRRYDEIVVEAASIQHRIEKFHKEVISSSNENKTSSSGNGTKTIGDGVFSFLPVSYTYDCYVPSAPGATVRLIDFNPAGGTTAALLFEWEEVLEDAAAAAKEGGKDDAIAEYHPSGREVEFRIIREDVAMRPDTALYGVPYDFVDLSEGSALSALMEQAQRGNIGGSN